MSEMTALMIAVRRGEAQAYRRLLEQLTRYLRVVVHAGLRRAGCDLSDSEDIVQEALLAIHLKRHTWDQSQPLEAWIRAIARHKLVDSMRRRGKRAHVDIDDVAEELAVAPDSAGTDARECLDLLARLPQRQQDIIKSISIEGRSAREVGDRLAMSEGAVRVALHRALKALAAAYRQGEA